MSTKNSVISAPIAQARNFAQMIVGYVLSLLLVFVALGVFMVPADTTSFLWNLVTVSWAALSGIGFLVAATFAFRLLTGDR